MQFKSLRRIYTLVFILGLSLAVIQPVAGSTALSKPAQAEPATLASLSGVVTDGSGHGYPLYARIQITASSFDQTIFSDPLTGAYAVDLEEGIKYTFTIDAYPPGYQTLVETLTPIAGALTQDFSLLVDPINCEAPGYQQIYDIFYDFEVSDYGFTPGGTTSFAWGEFTSGPMTGHSGSKGIATNPAGLYSPNENGYMLSPVIDLSGYGQSPVVLQWWDWKDIENVFNDAAELQATTDGGVTWVTLWGPVGGVQDSTYQQNTIILDPLYNVSNFQFRFLFTSDFVDEFPGWYIDDIGLLGIPADLSPVFSTNFDSNDAGFTPGGLYESWAHGTPNFGPSAAHSVPDLWATNPDGPYNANEYSHLSSPLIDLSPYAGQTILLNYWEWNDIEHVAFDYGKVQVSKDGGAHWQDVTGRIGDMPDWSPRWLSLDPSYAVSNFQFRFFFRSDPSNQLAGWYIDDVSLYAAGSSVFSGQCAPTPGGRCRRLCHR